MVSQYLDKYSGRYCSGPSRSEVRFTAKAIESPSRLRAMLSLAQIYLGNSKSGKFGTPEHSRSSGSTAVRTGRPPSHRLFWVHTIAKMSLNFHLSYGSLASDVSMSRL
jgi:hypothetical protein